MFRTETWLNFQRDFHVWLNVHPGMILVNNKPDAKFFFMYVYFYSVHVLGQLCVHHQENYFINMRVYVTLFS